MLLPAGPIANVIFALFLIDAKMIKDENRESSFIDV